MSIPIGIDLGTTYSAVAYMEANGKVNVLSNENQLYTTPSVVMFGENEVVVGEAAKSQAVSDPKRVISCIKREMDKVYPHTIGSRDYSPAEISAEILKEMKRIAESHIGPVQNAVITVPAYFGTNQRSATRKAAELAGLNVLKIINEPTAAAYSYFLYESKGDFPQNSTIMVYDLGGGTFDVTVMKYLGGANFETLATAGNARLGGVDWDKCILDYVSNEFMKKHGENPSYDLLAKQNLLLRAEKAKIDLSKLDEVTITCQYNGKSLPVTISRKQFEDMTKSLLNLTVTEIDHALADAKLTSKSIDMILLVGGSSKMPVVTKMLELKGFKVKSSRNPDYCVAMGAAIEAARLMVIPHKMLESVDTQPMIYDDPVEEELKGIKFLEKTPFGLGIILLENDELTVKNIINKYVKLPYSNSKDTTTNHDNQPEIDIFVVESKNDNETDPVRCAFNAYYTFRGIPDAPRGKPKIQVKYSYTEDNIIDLEATELNTRTKLEKIIQPPINLKDLLEKLKPAETQVRLSSSVALLMDASGSMRGQAISDARDACMKFIDESDLEYVSIGLVQFGMGSCASILHDLTRDSDSIKHQVNNLNADGNTPMPDAISCGMELLSGVSPEERKYIVLFTDGCPYIDDRTDAISQTIYAADKAKDAGIHIICIGVGNADQALLDRLATDNSIKIEYNQLVSTFGNIAQSISSGKSLESSS